VAEWLGRGLQNLAQRFNSAPRLNGRKKPLTVMVRGVSGHSVANRALRLVVVDLLGTYLRPNLSGTVEEFPHGPALSYRTRMMQRSSVEQESERRTAFGIGKGGASSGSRAA
jgi:hypothetical protein